MYLLGRFHCFSNAADEFSQARRKKRPWQKANILVSLSCIMMAAHMDAQPRPIWCCFSGQLASWLKPSSHEAPGVSIVMCAEKRQITIDYNLALSYSTYSCVISLFSHVAMRLLFTSVPWLFILNKDHYIQWQKEKFALSRLLTSVVMPLLWVSVFMLWRAALWSCFQVCASFFFHQLAIG